MIAEYLQQAQRHRSTDTALFASEQRSPATVRHLNHPGKVHSDKTTVRQFFRVIYEMMMMIQLFGKSRLLAHLYSDSNKAEPQGLHMKKRAFLHDHVTRMTSTCISS